ncbi:MAG: hypothetical protein AAF346_12625, partial [Pseudomonadota bacterium]
MTTIKFHLFEYWFALSAFEMCVRKLVSRFIHLDGWRFGRSIHFICAAAIFLVSCLLLAQPAAAQNAAINFGPLVDDNTAVIPFLETDVAVRRDLRSDAVLRVTVQADFSTGDSIAMTIDGVAVGTLSGGGNCSVQNFTFRISQATLAPLVADGNLAIRFTPSANPIGGSCLNGSGAFASLTSFSYALLGSLSFTTSIDRTIRNFVSRRADQITANDPNLSNRLSAISRPVRQGSIKDTGMKLGGTNGNVAFSASLRDVAASRTATREAAAGQRRQSHSRMSLGHGLPGTMVSSRFDVWVEGKLAKTDNDTADSTLGLLYVGADYRFSQSLVVGLLGQFDWSGEEDNAVSADIDGRGWMLGPYMAARLHKNIL